MAECNVPNRALFKRDNLDVLRGINSESIHLIATDPPFNKGKDFHATPESLASGASFVDRWKWDEDVHPDWIDAIKDDWPGVWAAIEAARVTHSEGMAAYLCWMGVRLMSMHRVLRQDGSLYLHCDPTAAAYLKTVLDAIFGVKNFRNEIVWRRAAGRAKGSQYKSKSYGSDTDSILFYVKSDDANFTADTIPLTGIEIKQKFPYFDDRGWYNTDVPLFCQPSMGKRPNLCYEYKGIRNPHPSGWRVSREKLAEMDARGEIIWREDKRPLRKSYAKDYNGKPIGSLWTDIVNLTGGPELTGYPTQKPLALYERIIKASSNEGDIVLDPFCGCATTPIAAERLGRKWIGIDIWEGAHALVVQRLNDNRQLLTDIPPEINPALTVPPERTDGDDVAAPVLRLKVQVAEPPGPKMSHAEMKAFLVQEYGTVCRGCDRVFDHDAYLQLDHMNPRKDGGINHITNRCLLCGPCNIRKSDRLTLTGLRKYNKAQKDGFVPANFKV